MENLVCCYNERGKKVKTKNFINEKIIWVLSFTWVMKKKSLSCLMTRICDWFTNCSKRTAEINNNPHSSLRYNIVFRYKDSHCGCLPNIHQILAEILGLSHVLYPLWRRSYISVLLQWAHVFVLRIYDCFGVWRKHIWFELLYQCLRPCDSSQWKLLYGLFGHK